MKLVYDGYNDRRNERDKEYGVNDGNRQQRNPQRTSNYNNIILIQYYYTSRHILYTIKYIHRCSGVDPSTRK